MSIPRVHLLFQRRREAAAQPATFEQFSARVVVWPRMFLEADGSFVLVGKAETGPWQLDGQVHDGRTAVDALELKGDCPAATLAALLAALSWREGDFDLLRLPAGAPLSLEEAHQFLAGNASDAARAPAPSAATPPRPLRTQFESLEDRRPLAIGPGGHDYQLLGPFTGLTWSAAEQAAAALTAPSEFGDGRLATISSGQEQAFLSATFGAQLGDQAAWLGFTDEALAGQWAWLDDSPGPWQDSRFFPNPTQASYVNWSTDEPAAPAVALVSAHRVVSVSTGVGEPYFQSSDEFGGFHGDLEITNPAGPGGRARQTSQVEAVGRILGGRADLSALPRGSARSTYEATFDLTEPESILLQGTLAGFVTSTSFELGGLASFEVRLRRLDAQGGLHEIWSDVQQFNSPGTQLRPLSTTLELAPGRYAIYVMGAADGAPVAGGRTATASWDFSVSLGSPRAAAFAGTTGGWLSLPATATPNYYLVEFSPLNGPQAVQLFPSGVAEDTPAGAVAGVLEVDGGAAPYTFELLNSAEGRFRLLDDKLAVAAEGALDFETQSTHTIRVRVTDALGRALERDIAVDVLDANEAPTGVFLDNGQIAENSPPGAIIGLLFANDPDWNDQTTFSLVDDAGGRFTIGGSYLRVAGPLDYEQAQRYIVKVRAADRGGLALEREFEVALGNVNEPPTLSAHDSYQASPGADLPLVGLDVSDPDIKGENVETRSLRLSLLVNQGGVSFATLDGLSLVAGENGGAAIALEGPLGALRRALDTVVYRAPADFQGVVELTLKANDLGNSGAGAPQMATLKSAIHLTTPLAAGEDAYQVSAGGRLFAQSYSAAVRSSAPWGWWRLDDPAGSPAALDSAAQHAGMVDATQFGGPSAIEGQPGNSARFGSAAARILVDAAPDAARGFTLEAWIKPANAGGLQQIASARGGGQGWAFGLSGQQLVLSAPDHEDYLATAALVRVGDWSHVAVAVGSDGSAAIYLDGAAVGQFIAAAPFASGPTLALGGHPDGEDESWTGDLDEVAVYERALPTDEIARHFAAAQRDDTVLANDGDGERPQRAELVAQPEHGAVELLPDGSFIYRPALGFAGVDSFRYRAVDGQIASAPTKVTITVVALPGDADFDGDVDLNDFALLKANFGAAGGPADGDFDGDGQIDLNDFAVLKANFGRRTGGQS
ncbi:MAG: LamG-like jellyroll fold domain-containing protein [Pirellulales bacterium]